MFKTHQQTLLYVVEKLKVGEVELVRPSFEL